MKSFNDKLADMLADWLSSMAMFYGLTFLIISTLYWQTPQGPIEWLQFFVQTFFQGVALPVLGFVSKKAAAKQEKLLQETHDTVMQELAVIKEEINLQREENQEIRVILEDVRKIKGFLNNNNII